MRLVLALAFVALQQTAPASIQGFVVRTGTSSPVTRAEVILQPADEDGQERTALTDGGGRFVLDGIQPGRYRVLAFREGYVDGEYGAVSEGEVGTILELASGEARRDIVVHLLPTGVISGALRDQYGEPYVNATVEALQYEYQGPNRVLTMARAAVTNDRGEYRLFWLEPGEYVVRATPRGMPVGGGNMIHMTTGGGGERIVWQSSSTNLPVGGATFTMEGAVRILSSQGEADIYGTDPVRLVPVYYPGTTDAGLATPIEVAAGRDYSGYNLRMVEVRTVSVRGRAVPSVTLEGFAESRTIVRLVRDTDVFVPGADEVMGRSGADGAFEIDGVAPGVYDLLAETSGYVGGTQLSLYARERINVGRADIDGLRIALEPGASISGLIDFGPVPEASESVFVGIQSSNSGQSRVQNWGANADGGFAFGNLAPGDYAIVVTGLPEGAYVDQIRAGAFVLEDNVVRLGTDAVRDVQVRVRNDSGTVQVGVADGVGMPVTGRRVQVVLVPDPSRRQRSDMYFASEATDGRVVFENVPPGSYKVFAWDGLPDQAWRNAEFLREYEDRGAPVTLSPLGTAMGTVNVISGSSNRR